ncbi:MAG: OadG family protein [Gammaproteobacteria bacterium]|jgi:sodium pump decarboxylase gamma subunit|nr:OadG family protein [Gammaproteobacteria bacterium]MDH3848257.1 OadG family protein [Gammaproteobacteria bacterium]MDH3862593.1 OadG family protein [Gammaproteobacteria bacterium]MDH3906279.1 OadG family protein [Gammaproteobacteria bacterium]MDH4003683.1 OadG family protein [Gammaproteobacteria bacterium]
MEESLLELGTMLLIAGMGTVFVFLTVLVGAMSLMANVVSRLQPAAPDDHVTHEEVAAIAAAIRRHRQS